MTNTTANENQCMSFNWKNVYTKSLQGPAAHWKVCSVVTDIFIAKKKSFQIMEDGGK